MKDVWITWQRQRTELTIIMTSKSTSPIFVTTGKRKRRESVRVESVYIQIT